MLVRIAPLALMKKMIPVSSVKPDITVRVVRAINLALRVHTVMKREPPLAKYVKRELIQLIPDGPDAPPVKPVITVKAVQAIQSVKLEPVQTVKWVKPV